MVKYKGGEGAGGREEGEENHSFLVEWEVNSTMAN